MTRRPHKMIAVLDRVDGALRPLSDRLAPAAVSGIDKWRTDAAAVRYHLSRPADDRGVAVVVGGTGTGKSTLVNRLIGHPVTAASFRRTFTTGPVAVVSTPTELPDGWLGVDHVSSDGPPPRGQTGALVIVVASPTGPSGSAAGSSAASTDRITPLVDTPDLDGDQPANHAQADRAFRWAGRVVFVVTPEKYQMTEMLPYYRLADRYGIPAVFVMNKNEEAAVVDDFRRQLIDRGRADPAIFIVPRDDAAYDAPADQSLDALRANLANPTKSNPAGLSTRVDDAAARLTDQVIGPMREARKHVDQLQASLRAMEAPAAGVDVNPITQQLQRRLQQRSVLYLLGPQRMLDRVRQVPTLLGRLPRATWDWVMRGNVPADLIDPSLKGADREPPDFPATLADQFTVVRSRIDDLLRSDPAGKGMVERDGDNYSKSLLDPASAAAIAAEEIAVLRTWLEKHWNATPRDTRMLQALLKRLPGGAKLTKWSEAAPYLLTIAVVTHHAFFGHIDLLVLGGWGLATWATEKVSNEVSGHTRATNKRIDNRFEALAHEQLERVCEWLDRQAPTAEELRRLESLAAELAEPGDGERR